MSRRYLQLASNDYCYWKAVKIGTYIGMMKLHATKSITFSSPSASFNSTSHGGFLSFSYKPSRIFCTWLWRERVLAGQDTRALPKPSILFQRWRKAQQISAWRDSFLAHCQDRIGTFYMWILRVKNTSFQNETNSVEHCHTHVKKHDRIIKTVQSQ